jgi:uncharacterized protein YggU (UPF0235/DUF167 family)
MKIEVKVHPRSSKNLLKKESSTGYSAYLTVSPVDNMANRALIELLSEEFKVSKSSIRIILGFKSRRKVVEVVTPPRDTAGSPPSSQLTSADPPKL